MAINLEHEQLLTLAEAAERLPRLRKSRKVHVATLYRWVSRGLGGVRLEAVRIGRTLVTSVEALQRFAERRSTHAAVPMEVKASRGLERAERELDGHGL